MAQKTVLGRGLGSLLPRIPGSAGGAGAAGSSGVAAAVLDAAQSALVTSSLETQVNAVAAEVPSRDRHMGISLVALDSIVANDYQPRRDFDASALEELAQSIRTNGVIQPLVVRKTPSGYMLIAGERRLRASKIAGLKQVPVVIRKTTDREALELALVENIQRQDLNCIDEALAYFQLIQDFSLTQEEVAERVGKDRATVANHLRLLRLPEAIIDDLKRQILSFGHGKALLVVDDNDIRLRARQQIVEKKLSVRETEALMDSLKKGESFEAAAQKLEAKGKPQNPIQARLSQLAHGLTRQFSTRVEVKGSEKRGKIVLHYSTRADLDRLLTSLQEKN